MLSYLIPAALFTHLWFKSNDFFLSLKLILTLLAIPLPSLFLSTNLVTAYFIYAVTLLLSITLYRLSPFHPLATYPGPLLCRLTQLWALYLARQGQLHLYYKELHNKYGPVVRIGPNELSIINADLLPDIFGRNGMAKGPLMDARRTTQKGARSIVSLRSLQQHAQARKPWNKAFSINAQLDYEEILVPRLMQLIGHLGELCRHAGPTHVNIEKWISYFSFDFMGSFTLSGGFELMRDGDKEGILTNMESALYTLAISQPVPWLAPLFRLTSTQNNKFALFGIKQAQRRVTMDNAKRDLFHHLIAATAPDLPDNTNPEGAYSIVLPSVLLAIVAGSDTTASTVTAIIYYLCRYPEYIHEIREEVDTVFPAFATDPKGILDGAGCGYGLGYEGRVPEGLSKLPMLNAIINETLRLLPPVPTATQRAPEKGSGGKMLGSIFISESTAVRVPIYVLHRDPRYFSPDPDKFWPERWILDSHQPKIITDRTAFIPFSTGPASCVGRNLAMAELRYSIALLVGLFDFRFADEAEGKKWESELRDCFVWLRKPLVVRMNVRGGDSY